MRTLRTFDALPPADRGACVAIGNFDGVHLGHRAVIGLAQEAARDLGVLSGVLTFEPHPREMFVPDAPPFRLMNAEARADQLSELGLDLLYQLDFARIAPLAPERFAREVLASGLAVRSVVVGRDFRYGKGRAGDAALLASEGRNLGFDVVVAPLLATGGVEVSSTRIREALSAGRPEEAARMLGHLHRIEGEVLNGDKRGRALGYPTANLSIAGLHPPRFGVYAVRVTVKSGPHAGEHDGVASIGVRPTFGGNLPNLEVHLFEFAGELYGAHLSVALVAFLRPEVRFDTAPALVSQMDADSAAAREILRSATLVRAAHS